jgi:hypothetical protein
MFSFNRNRLDCHIFTVKLLHIRLIVFYLLLYVNRFNKILTVKIVDMFDHGIRARRDREAGNMYQGLPITSYSAVFLDHTMGSNGERNIKFVCEEGREYKVGVYKGIAELPASWGLASGTQARTK